LVSGGEFTLTKSTLIGVGLGHNRQSVQPDGDFMKSVCFIYPPSYHYRAPFHENLRKVLLEHDVKYTVFYSDLGEKDRFKNDTVEIEWGRKVPLTRIRGGEYQHALREALRYDLIIVQQENKLLINYILNIASIFGLKKIAFFGHGRNFQSRNPDGFSEWFKRFWVGRVDWWFGYTNETRRHVEKLGFPADRITVFNNSVDTSKLCKQIAEVTPSRLATLRTELGLSGFHVGVFVGGIYPDKRMDFLAVAADHVRSRIPDFEMIVVGGGLDLPVITKLAESRLWLHVTGPRFGQDKVELMMLGHVFLMPGLIGLAILDAGAAGLPVATTAFPWHSPEIAYLEPGRNGIMVRDWENPEAYGNAVADLLLDPERLLAMSVAARDMASHFSIENMAANFAKGVLEALRT
jgi:glycosyltransferase involved in cell wall biosynthesis